MSNRIKKVTFRLTEQEDKFLRGKMKEASEKTSLKKEPEYSVFIRETLLERNGCVTDTLRRQLYDLRYEMRKIGVNINQVTKKINSNLYSQSDVVEIKNLLSELEALVDRYETKLEEAWQSQN